jgi:hypothetical protein
MIDTDGLHQICRSVGITDLTKLEYQNDSATQWSNIFHVDKMTTATRRFADGRDQRKLELDQRKY